MEESRSSGTRQFGVFVLLAAVGVRATAPAGLVRAGRPCLVRTVKNKAVHAVEQVAREFQHLLSGGGELRGTGSGLLHEFAHLVHGADDGLFVGCGADLLGELVDFGDDVRDFVKSGTKVVAEGEAFLDDARAALHVFNGLTGFALNALNEVRDFLRGLGGLFGEFADFIGNNGKPQTVLTRAGRFDGGVQREQVGLFGKVIDDFNDFSDVIGTVAQNVNDLGRGFNGLIGTVETVGGLLHGLDASDDFLARAVGDVEQDLGGIGHPLNRGNHLVDGGGGLRHAGGLYLRILDHVLHVDAHLVHGAGDFFNRGGSLDADLGGLIGSASDLIGTGRDLPGGIAGGPHELLQTVGHAKEGIAERVAPGAGHDFDGQIAFGNRHGNAGHLLEVSDHVVEGGGESANFVIAVNIDVLVEVAGVADFTGDGNEVSQGFGDGLGGIKSDDCPKRKGDQCSQDRGNSAKGSRTICRVGGILQELGDIRVALIENHRGFREPRSGVFLKIENLQVRNGGIARIHLMALGDERLGEIVSPTGFGALHLNESGAYGFVGGLRFTALDDVGDVVQASSDSIFVARIAAEEKVIHVEAIQHDLVTHGFNSADAFQSGSGIGTGRFLHPSGKEVYEK